MKCKEIIESLEQKYAPDFAESWDNVGLLVGDKEKEVHKIFLALDVTDESLEMAIKEQADMIITHHPLIFSAMKKVTTDNFIGRRIIKMIQHDISYYAMHTNFDILGMADLSADFLNLKDREILEVTYSDANRTEGLGRVGNLARKMSLKECADFVKTQLKLPSVTVDGDLEKEVQKVAVCTGSGKSLIKEVLKHQADVYVTGDADYHFAIDAVAQDVCIIDAGHYGTEYIFMDYMEKELQALGGELEIKKMQVIHPFKVL